jgi:hypothetical protein
MLRSASVAAAVVVGLAQTATAQVTTLYSTSFQSPTYSDGALAPVTVATDTTTPGQDGWLNTNAGLTNPIQVSNSATNGIVSLVAAGGQDVRRPLSSTVSSGSIFLDAHVTVSSATATGDYALHLSDAVGTANFNERVFFKASGAGFVMALGTGSGTTPTYGTTELPFGTLIHVLARYDFVTGGTTNDTGALFINPTTMDGSGDTPYVAATTQGTDAVSLANVALRQGGATSAPALTVDDLAVFATTPVPEPSSLALLGVAGGAMVIRRWRKGAAV